MINVHTALNEGRILLQQSPSPRIDAEILLLHVLKKNKTFVYSHPEALLTSEERQQYQHLLQERSLGYPIAYLTGTKEFWSLPLLVTPDTLIPRPETERLIEIALNLLSSVPSAQILDLGTGTGAIALAMASERADCIIHAFDQSEKALHVARKNATHLNISQVAFGQSNWYESISLQPYHAIISNPPYIADNDHHLTEGDLRFEPRQALASGTDGLADLREIISKGISYLYPNGFLLVEHGFDQKDSVTQLFQQQGYIRIQNFNDIQGNDRATVGFRPPR